MIEIFDINNVLFSVLGYDISLLEFIGTIFGLICVYYASRANIITWPAGIISEIFLFSLFFQVQLYADMFLQLFFIAVNSYGWYNWNKNAQEQKTFSMKPKEWLFTTITVLSGTAIFGYITGNLHVFFPSYFTEAAAYPFIDSFVMSLSIVATYLMAIRRTENWHLWILVNLICVFLFFYKGVVFLSLEYFIFLGIATYGLLNWRKLEKIQINA